MGEEVAQQEFSRADRTLLISGGRLVQLSAETGESVGGVA